MFIDPDPDPITGETNLLRKMTKVDEKSLVTFKGFAETLEAFECAVKTKVLKRLMDLLRAYNWRLDAVDFYRFLREVSRHNGKNWDVCLGRAVSSEVLVGRGHSEQTSSG